MFSPCINHERCDKVALGGSILRLQKVKNGTAKGKIIYRITRGMNHSLTKSKIHYFLLTSEIGP